jgi:hypothetical protein
MAALPPYHANPQTATLLVPVRANLHDLVTRTHRYEERLRLVGDADRAAHQAASEALAAAERTINALVAAARPTPTNQG